MLEKYDRCALKDVHKIVPGGKSWIMWAFEDTPNPTKVVSGKSTTKQMVACFFSKTGHVTTIQLEQSCTVNSR